MTAEMGSSSHQQIPKQSDSSIVTCGAIGFEHNGVLTLFVTTFHMMDAYVMMP